MVEMIDELSSVLMRPFLFALINFHANIKLFATK